jgi:hypothetical protein
MRYSEIVGHPRGLVSSRLPVPALHDLEADHHVAKTQVSILSQVLPGTVDRSAGLARLRKSPSAPIDHSPQPKLSERLEGMMYFREVWA